MRVSLSCTSFLNEIPVAFDGKDVKSGLSFPLQESNTPIKKLLIASIDLIRFIDLYTFIIPGKDNIVLLISCL